MSATATIFPPEVELHSSEHGHRVCCHGGDRKAWDWVLGLLFVVHSEVSSIPDGVLDSWGLFTRAL